MIAALIATGLSTTAVSAKTICTVVANATTGKIIVQEGDCENRVTPASTFKIAISLMGFDAGVLQDAHAPSWPYQSSYPAWGGDAWRQPADPERWIKYSVFWFSQQVVERLGKKRFQGYIGAFGYGNQDVSGASIAWTQSSLRISPLEQIAFLRKLVNRQLPVSTHAYEVTSHITRIDAAPTGWEVHGKTGTGSPGSQGQYDAARAYGWFVGWATQGDQQLVFARLIQDEQPTTPNAGLRARDSFLDELPTLANRHVGRGS